MITFRRFPYVALSFMVQEPVLYLERRLSFRLVTAMSLPDWLGRNIFYTARNGMAE